MDSLKLPEMLTCRNIEAYVTSALKLIESDGLRCQISSEIKEKNLLKLFESETIKYRSELSEVIEGLYREKYIEK